MFQNIVIPLDLTDKHERALEIAAELSKQGGGSVVLLHVIEVIPGLEREEEKTFYDRLERVARKHLDRLGGILAERGVNWRAEVLYGSRALEIARYSTQAAADLIVVTSPRIDPQNPAIGWASMSYRIGLLAPCPVLLVK